MRDIKRIERMLEKLRIVWEAYPDLRFGQLLINMRITSDNNRDWMIEDNMTEKQIDYILKQGIA